MTVTCPCQLLIATKKILQSLRQKKPVAYYYCYYYITFIQDINNYVPETHLVSRGYNVTALLSLQYTVRAILLPIIKAVYWYRVLVPFQSMCVVPSTNVFCNSLMCCPRMSLRYFLNDSEMVPTAPLLLVSLSCYFAHKLPFYRYDICILRSLRPLS